MPCPSPHKKKNTFTHRPGNVPAAWNLPIPWKCSSMECTHARFNTQHHNDSWTWLVQPWNSPGVTWVLLGWPRYPGTLGPELHHILGTFHRFKGQVSWEGQYKWASRALDLLSMVWLGGLKKKKIQENVKSHTSTLQRLLWQSLLPVETQLKLNYSQTPPPVYSPLQKGGPWKCERDKIMHLK